jgi:hypothetical protein
LIGLVDEVSDDKNLKKMERKRLQIEHAPHASYKGINFSKPGYTSIIFFPNIPYNLIFTTKFNDLSILITII